MLASKSRTLESEKTGRTTRASKDKTFETVEKKNPGEGLRDDEVELLGAGEVADAGVGDVGRLVSRHHVVPHAHLRLFNRLLRCCRRRRGVEVMGETQVDGTAENSGMVAGWILSFTSKP